MRNEMAVLRSNFPLILTLVLSGCYGPSQDFEVGSDLWLKSNPEWVMSGSTATQVRKRVTVAVLDGGVDYNHPRIRGQLQSFPADITQTGRTYGIGFDLMGGPFDFFPHYSVLNPENGIDTSDTLQVRDHATHVAGLATLGNPEIGLLPVRVLPIPEGPSSGQDSIDLLLNEKSKVEFAIEAVNHVGRGVKIACLHGAQVLNLSLGISFNDFSSEGRQTVQESLESGIVRTVRQDCENSLLVVAAGNESREMTDVSFSIPVTLEEKNILGVGALKSKALSRTAYYSNQGRYVDIYIQGTHVNSSVPGTEEEPDQRASLTGTSMATPLISHLAARILLILPALAPEEVRALILNTAVLTELELEQPPVDESGVNSVPALPLKRMGLVASFARALRVAREISVADDARKVVLAREFLKAPFEHGHSPF